MRAVLALVLILAVSAASVFFADRPGTATLIWQGWRVDMSVGLLVAGVTAAALLLWGGIAGLSWLFGAPRRLARRRREARRLSGYHALTEGLVAIAAGDTRAAERLRLTAERHFAKSRHATPPLTRLLAAQAALLRGDHPTARDEFNRMLESPETEFLGLRGLIVQALKEGDDATALKLTERANRLRPATAWVLQSQLALETRAREWRRAERTLSEALKRGAVTSDQGRRHRVALLLARAADAVRDGHARDALKAASRAHGLDPAFAPAATAYATLLAGENRVGRALKTLERTWSRTSHPSLAALYGRLLGDAEPMERIKRFERLDTLRPGDVEFHLAAASIALAAKLWGETRRHLDAAGAAGPGPWPQRLAHLMAELEEGENQDAAAAKRWLERARHAPADPGWVCDSCGAEAPGWEPLCPRCHSFDSLAWRVSDRTAALPLADGKPRSPAEAAAMLELGHALGNPGRTVTGEVAETAARGGGA
jgi:HemY protein